MVILPFAVFGETIFVKGDWEYIYEIVSNDRTILDNFVEYSNESNSQKILSREGNKITVKNTVNLSYFTSNVKYPVDNLYANKSNLKTFLDFATIQEGYTIKMVNGKRYKEDFTKRIPLEDWKVEFLKKRAEQVVASASTQQEAIEKLVSYVRDTVSYQLGTSTDPVDVLRNGRAFCEGYANVFAMLCRVIGIPARKVSCYIPPGHMWGLGGSGGSGGFHAYVDVYYDDKGWVSYDPQNSVHFVDPFHIVGFPRNGARLNQLQTTDEREFLDITKHPAAWDEFYSRTTENKQNNALLIGKIMNRNGVLVKDSYDTKQWVYINNKRAEHPGVKINENGAFVIPIFDLNKSKTFYFTDPNGAFLQKTINFDSIKRHSETYDLSDKSETIIMTVENARKRLYFWWKNDAGQWKLSEVPTDRQGTIALLLDEGDYVFSQSNNIGDPRYVLSVGNNGIKSGEIDLADLRQFLDESHYYVYGKVIDENGKGLPTQINVSSSRGFYPSLKSKSNGQFTYLVQNPSFNTVNIKANGFLFIEQVNFSEEKHVEIEIDLRQEKLSTIVSKPNTQIYFNVSIDARRVQTKYSGTTDSSGVLRFSIPSGEYMISVGRQYSQNMETISVDANRVKSYNIE